MNLKSIYPPHGIRIYWGPMLRIRFHGRGGQGVKTSSRILGRAAFLAGFLAQDSPIYGAERRGAPVVAFTRISDSLILERGFIFNPHIVVVMDESLIGDWLARPLEGLLRGGVALINTAQAGAPLEVSDSHVVVRLNITDEALKIIGRPVISAPAAASAAKITGLIRKKQVLEATVEELTELGLAEETVEKNLRLVSEVYDMTPHHSIKIEEEPSRSLEVVDLRSDRVVFSDILEVGNAYLRKTGNWRVFTPVVDYGKCTGCMVCYVYCPDSAVKLNPDKKPVIDYENCKGCLICVLECPMRAISFVREAKVYA
ncbi:MAG: 2-oxoacid:acceptor oxidoreductase family protein [Candidatus Caldarchaeum sp.]|nr:2-oxoacid:acceptor oxidoreductase family protein [Candidatus Caldarchaeum sp.]